jgi:hypothetical protein
MEFYLERDAGTEYVLRYLPYLETTDGTRVEVLADHWPQGYGYGSLVEYFYSREAAEMRIDWLDACNAVEDWEIRRFDPSGGRYYSILVSNKEESK